MQSETDINSRIDDRHGSNGDVEALIRRTDDLRADLTRSSGGAALRGCMPMDRPDSSAEGQIYFSPHDHETGIDSKVLNALGFEVD